MRRNRNKNKKITLLLCLLLIVGIGIGYAVLSERLLIDGTISYGNLKWDVGFKTAVDGGGSVSSNPSISEDKKSITIECNIGTSTSSETCIATAVIENNSTFDVQLSEAPVIEFDNTYIDTVSAVWTDDSSTIEVLDSIGNSTTKEMKITITTKELTKETLPSETMTLPVTVTMKWVESTSN